MRVIYIAGPYRATSEREKTHNIIKARNVAHKLWQEGWAVICPHLNTAYFDNDCPKVPDQTWLEGDLEILKRCDAIYMLKGWQASQGAKGELELAKARGLTVIYEEYQCPGIEFVSQK